MYDVRSGEVFHSEETSRIYGVENKNPVDLAYAVSFYHKEDLKVLEKSLSEAVEQGRPYDIISRFTSATGENKLVRSTGYPLFDNDQVIQLAGIFQDVTGVKQLYERKLQHDSIFKKLFDGLAYPLLVIRPDGMIVLANRTLSGYMRVAEGSLSGKNIFDVFPDQKRVIKERIDGVINGTHDGSYDGPYVNSEGKIEYIHTQYTLINSVSNEQLILILSYDKTPEMQWNKDLLHLNEKLNIAHESAELGLWEWDSGSENLTWDQKMFEIYERDPGSFTPTIEAWQSTIYPDDQKQAFFDSGSAVTSKSSKYESRFRILTPSGKIKYIKANARLFYEDGNLLKVIGATIDETGLRLAEENARKASEAKSSFLANMSHEIRTPLNSIIGFSELLLDSELDRNQKGFLINIKNSAKILNDLVSDILDFSKIEAGVVTLDHSPADLREILAAIGNVVRHAAVLKRNSVTLEIPENQDLYVKIDSLKIRQIMINLVMNAVKFTDKGKVIIRLKRKPLTQMQSEYHFEVQDTGIGISEEQQEKIMNAFVQADPSTTRRYGGTGLGLSISSSLIEKMGGHLNVESEPGEGSVFSFSLVLEDIPEQEYLNSLHKDSILKFTEDNSLPVDRKLNILVVEDAKINAQVAGAILRKHLPLCEITFAENGSIAVDNCKKSRPDLILMDVQMPVMNGYEAAREIRILEKGTNQRVPIIALTAGVDHENKEECIKSGMDYFLPKPIQINELLRILSGHNWDKQ